MPANAAIDQEILGNVEVIFKHPACINGSFLSDAEKHVGCTSTNHGVDLEIAESTFEFIKKIENAGLMQLIRDSVTTDLLKSLPSSPAHVEALRLYLILPLFHEFLNAKNNAVLHSPFSEAVLRLSEIPKRILKQWWAGQSVEYFERLVGCFKEVVSYVIHYNFQKTDEQKKIVSDLLCLGESFGIFYILIRCRSFATRRISCWHCSSFDFSMRLTMSIGSTAFHTRPSLFAISPKMWTSRGTTLASC